METTNYYQTESGLYVPDFYVKSKSRPIAFDFFCGCGGFGCGIIEAGFEIVGANEYDPYATITYMVNLGHYPMTIHYLDGKTDKDRLDKTLAQCWGIKGYKPNDGLTEEKMTEMFKHQDKRFKELNYAYNDDKDEFVREYGTDNVRIPQFVAGSGFIHHYPELVGVKNFWFGDMHLLKGEDILNTLGLRQGDLDLVTGGPPCQGFSKAGKQDINDTRNALIYEYARLIVELQPKTFVMEEVPDVLDFMDPDGVPVIDKFCMLLQEGGYGKWEMIKKSLGLQAERMAGVAIKGRGTSPQLKKSKSGKKKSNVDNQMNLFSEQGDVV